MKPTYVTFEQAKLLKEKGFDFISKQSYEAINGYSWAVNQYQVYQDYRELGNKYPDSYKSEIKLGRVETNSSSFTSVLAYYKKEQTSVPSYHAPEQWQVVEWLRVKYGIWIEVYYDDSKKEYYTVLNGEEYKFQTPQEAYSAAFDYILTNLI